MCDETQTKSLAMKKVLFLLLAVWMSAATFGQTLGQQTITFMNCINCDNYFEPNVNTLDMVGLIISADTILEMGDYDGICSQFYNEFPVENLPGVSSVFLRPDDADVRTIVVRKDVNGNTRAMYLLTWYGWLQSVDMQDFWFFDRLLLLFRYPDSNINQPILRKNEPFR